MTNKYTQFVLPLVNTAVTVTNVPLAETALAGSAALVRRVDLSDYNEVRLVAKVSTLAAGTELRAKFDDTDISTTVGNYTELGHGATEVGVSLAATGMIDSGWLNINEDARRDVNILLVTQGGDGALDPVIDNVTLHFRSNDKFI